MRFIVSKLRFSACKGALAAASCLSAGVSMIGRIDGLIHDDVGNDALVLDIAPVRRNVAGGRDLQRALIGRRERCFARRPCRTSSFRSASRNDSLAARRR